MLFPILTSKHYSGDTLVSVFSKMNTCLTFRFAHLHAETGSLIAIKHFDFHNIFLSKHKNKKKSRNKNILQVLQNNEMPIMFFKVN